MSWPAFAWGNYLNATVPEVDNARLRDRREALLAQLDLRGIDFCRQYAQQADEWLRNIATAAAAGQSRNVALVAIGGYGRGELSPYSDLDLLLLHDGFRKVKTLADAIWYPVWDEGIALDHSVRRPKEAYALAHEDLRVALGLLDGRFLWGDERLATRVIDRVTTLWSHQLGELWIPELESQMSQRHGLQGDLADLLEPDIKESHGGLRDVNVLTAVRQAIPELVTKSDFVAVERARNVLLDVRVGLHRTLGRGVDRLQLQDQDQVAALLAYDDADDLMRAVSSAGRTVALMSDATWAHLRYEREIPVEQRHARLLEDGIEQRDGQLGLTDDADVANDETLTLRLAALSSERDVPMAVASLERLWSAKEPQTPWSDEVRAAFLRLLSAPRGLVRSVETLNTYGLFTRLLPEWSFVRSYHQRNVYHRFTADRHLLEAVRYANDLLPLVTRKDLLLLGTLFHDIGKGHDGDHTAIGVELVQQVAPRMGFNDRDTSILVAMVRHHLLLPDTATRRDLDDPATIRFVAAAIGDEEVLELVGALASADGMATGTSAWGSWKAQLVTDLIERVRVALRGENNIVSTFEHQNLIEQARESGLVVHHDDHWIIVAVRDQPRLLATITGVLAVAGLDVRSADVHAEEGIALDKFFCSPGPRGWPDVNDLTDQIRAALASPEQLSQAIRTRIASYAHRPRSAQRIEPGAIELPTASDRATVIEVRALDHVGLLHVLATTVADAHVDVKAARLTTVGDFAVDTFYVTDSQGRALGPDQAQQMTLLLSETARATM